MSHAPCRLEELNEKRQGLVGKLKGAEREKEGLEGKALEAGAYLSKQAERLRQQMVGTSIYVAMAQVRRGNSASHRALRKRA